MTLRTTRSPVALVIGALQLIFLSTSCDENGDGGGASEAEDAGGDFNFPHHISDATDSASNSLTMTTGGFDTQTSEDSTGYPGEQLSHLQAEAWIGPLVLGSSVTILPTNHRGDHLGNNYHTEVSERFGRFSTALAYVGPAVIEVHGVFTNYLEGELSDAPIILRSRLELNPYAQQLVSINVLTHMISPRMRSLLSAGLDTGSARRQATRELINVLPLVGGAIFDERPVHLVAIRGGDQTQERYLWALQALLLEAAGGEGRPPGATARLQGLLDALAHGLDSASGISPSIIESLRQAALRLDTLHAKDAWSEFLEHHGIALASPNIDLVIDSDADGWINELDNCRRVANPQQLDRNNDGVGDVCCGDGVSEGNEECDLGPDNSIAGACLLDCTHARCGDGYLHAVREECDDGNLEDGDGCDHDCTHTRCGNNIVTRTEACDDGNRTDGDGCDNNCTVSACGNGVVASAEDCDDGNLVSGDGCDVNCTVTSCGNGILTGSEVCDDSNLVDGDGCDSNCTVTACGNGIQTKGEACDDNNLDDEDTCTSDCRLHQCGDGLVGAGEDCDDGNLIEGDGCDSNCTRSACGNGIQSDVEECDDNNTIDADHCTAKCSLARCGDGIVGPNEECDDGNHENGDGCDNNCTTSRCGNGITAGSEVCDDGNRINTDDCTDRCQRPSATCGNGIREYGEECDDGASNGCCFCLRYCEKSCKKATCGNGRVDPGEECDVGCRPFDTTCTINCTRPQ